MERTFDSRQCCCVAIFTMEIQGCFTLEYDDTPSSQNDAVMNAHVELSLIERSRTLLQTTERLDPHRAPITPRSGKADGSSWLCCGRRDDFSKSTLSRLMGHGVIGRSEARQEVQMGAGEPPPATQPVSTGER